ncbi:MAG: hypothetical protein ACI8T1_001989 [Verrucomicrobiales bacterium]|jgi:hypothetical protein
MSLSMLVSQAQDVGDIELLAWWKFDDSETPDVAIDEVAGIEGEIITATYGEGRGDGGTSMNFIEAGSTVAIVGEEESKAGFMNKGGARDQLSFVFWQKWDEPIRDQSAFWTRAEGMDRAAQAHTPWSNGSIYFDTSGGCCDAGTQRTNIDASDLPYEDEWIHFSFIKNKATKQLWANGELLIESENTGEFNDIFQDLFIGSAQDGANNHGGRIDDFAVIAGALSEEQIKTLADPSNSVITIFDNSNPGISLNTDQTLSAGVLPALTSAQELQFAIKNTIKPEDGGEVLTISSLEITGGDTDNFTLVSAPTSLDPNTTGDLVLSFNNKGAFGSFSVTMNAKSNDADAEDQDINFTVRATVLNPVGPIAHYPLDETDTANGVADSTGLGRGGVFQGNVGLGQAGLKDGTGTAATFAGGSSVAVSTLPSGGLSSFTVALWMNPASLGDLGASDFRTVFAKGEANPVFGLLEGNGEFVWFGEIDGNPDAVFLTEGLGIQAGTTYHVAMRYDGIAQVGTFFVDGVEVGSGDVGAFEDLGSFYIGAFGEGALPFEGTLDDVQLYDFPLDTDQLAYLIANPGQELVPVGAVDTDLDGLTDDAEATTHNTDPLKADTDGDGLNDGREVNDTKTDPLLVDTDGDGSSDGSELIFGADPLDSDSKLGEFLVRTIKGADGVEFGSMEAFKEALEDQSQIAEEVAGNFTFINFRDSAQGNFPNDEVPFALWETFGDRSDFGIHVTGKINVTEAGVRTFGMNSDDGNQLFIDGALVAEDPGTHGSQDVFGSIDLAVGEHDLEMFFYERGGGAQVELFVNTALGNVTSFDAGNFVLLPGFGTPSSDLDGDGLSDFFENGFFGNLDQGADDDGDSDGLSNLAEQAAKTNPTVADTDGDGVNDGDELADTTNPLSADTDGDGLSDSDEKTRGTSPTSRDTDGDEFPDGFEVAQGSDPLDSASPGSLPDPPESLVALWTFNNGTTSDIGDHVGELRGNAVISGPGDGYDGPALDLGSDQAGQAMLVASVDFFNAVTAEDKITVAYWQQLRAVLNQTTFKGRSPSSDGTERGISVHTPWSDRNFYYDTAGCCTASQRTSVGVDVDYTQWHHIVFTKDGPTKKIFVDGVEQIEGQNDAPLPTDFTELWIGGGTDGAESMAGLLDDFAIYSEALEQGDIDYLASGGRYKLSAGAPSANLVGYWPANDAAGTVVSNVANPDLSGTLSEGTWVAGSTGVAGDFAVELTGAALGASNVEVPPTGKTFEQITITGWVNGVATGDWTGLVQARGASTQPIGIGFRAGSGQLTYTWNSNNAETYNFVSDLAIPADAWTFVALTVTPDGATLFVGSDGVLSSAENAIPHAAQVNDVDSWFFGKDNCCDDARNFDGQMDDISIWDVALSGSELESIFLGVETPLSTRAGGRVPGPVQSDDVPTIGTVIAGPSSLGLSFTGLAGKSYDIEYSTDLVNWSVIISDLSGEVNFEDSDAARRGVASGYYRGVQK